MKDKTIWIGFLTNLLGVVLGIILTFGVNALWQQHEEKKKTREMLILVRNELENNREWFKTQERIMREDSYVYKKILDLNGDYSSVPIDTIRELVAQTIALQFSQLTTSAWQIFQNSEMIQKMTDKELVIRLTDCYFWINKIEELIMTQYWDTKTRIMVSEVDAVKYLEVLMNNKEAEFFYTMMSSGVFSSTIWNIFPFIDAIIDYTILLLDHRGDYRYDMADKDEEINSFIQFKVDSVLQLQDTIQENNILSEEQDTK